MNFYGENIYNDLTNRIKDNKANFYISISLSFNIIYDILKKINDKSKNNIAFMIIKFIINSIFLCFVSHYFDLYYITFYTAIIMILKFISLVYKCLLIFIYFLSTITIFIKRKLMIKMIREDNIKDKKRYRAKILFNDLIKNKIRKIAVFIIKFIIIINFYFQINSNNIISKYSKISLKIKGIGELNILGKNQYNCFEGINYLKQVNINGNKQDTIEYKYNFTQTDNFVELIWDDNLNNCKYMFRECTGITEIDLSNFNTSKVTNMYSMFYQCSSLTSLNLSCLNTSQVTDMAGMFFHCKLLTSLDLLNFNTSQVKRMQAMFNGCQSLTSLDLSNFNVSENTNIEKMFYSCSNLEFINLYSFNEEILKSFVKIFEKVPINIVFCLNENINKDNISQIKALSCHVIYCSEDWKSKQKIIISDTQNCIENCEKTELYKYEYNGICVENCPNGYIYDNNDNNKLNICKCELEKCLTCPKVALNLNLCTKCNINYYSKENDPLNLGE